MTSIKDTLYSNGLTTLLAIFCIICLLIFGGYLYSQIQSYLLRRKLKKRFDHARDGEKSAKDLLTEAGYLIEETQKTSKLPMWINGKQFLYLVRPDAFASKDGQRYLVEIKTGKVANNPKHSATRRQLLEYFHGFSVDGVLLVDAEAEQIHNVHFEGQKKQEETRVYENPRMRYKLLIAFILGVITAIIFSYISLKGEI